MQAIEEMERELKQPLGHFRSAVTALTEREMARRPRRAMVPAGRRSGWRPVWVYAWAPAVLLLLLTVGLVLANQGPAAQPATQENSVARVESGPAPRKVSDNALMTEIDEDLTQNVPTAMAPLEVSTTSKTHTNSTQSEDTYGVEP